MRSSSGEESAPDGAEQAAAPGVVHIDVGAPWRSEEAEFRTSHARHTFLAVSAVLCRAVSRNTIEVSFFFEFSGVCSLVSRCTLSCP